MDNDLTKRKKRTQRDYNLVFKLAVVNQVIKSEMIYNQAKKAYGIQGRSTVLAWLRKYGNLDWSKSTLHTMKTLRSKETPARRIKRLEKKVRR